jgi:hypothetical protein
MLTRTIGDRPDLCRKRTGRVLRRRPKRSAFLTRPWVSVANDNITWIAGAGHERDTRLPARAPAGHQDHHQPMERERIACERAAMPLSPRVVKRT